MLGNRGACARSALKEVKIPPGPRLRILHHVALVRAASASRSTGKGAAPVLGPLSLALPLEQA